MSTKTTIKRVALVAAVALTLGGFSAVSASAAYVPTPAGGNATVAIGTSIVQDATTGDAGINGVAGPANSLVVNIQQATDTPTTTTYGAYVTVSGAGATITAGYKGTNSTAGQETLTIGTTADTGIAIAANGLSATLPGGDTPTANLMRALRIATPTAGSVVINVYNATVKGANPSSYSSTAAASLTITVNATAIAGTLSVANSTFYDTTTTAGTPTASLTTTPVVVATAGTPGVTYAAALKDANGSALASTTSWSVTLTGPGSLAASNTTATGARVLTGTGSAPAFTVFGDGTSGSSVVTLAVGSTVIGTKNVSWYSTTVASLSATTKYNVAVAATGGYSATSSKTIFVVAKDSSGNAISAAAGATGGLTATSSNTAIATVGAVAYDANAGGTGVAGFYVPVTGVAEGSAVITIADTTGLIKATATVLVTTGVAAKITTSTDAASYDAGTLVTYTITATDAAGNPVADGSYVGFLATAPVTNVAVQGFSESTTATFLGGKYSTTFYAPLSAGNVTVAGGVVGSTTAIATALQASTLATATFAVNGDANASLAVDAANAATDAANAAAEEASNATEAASEALAAVNALATTVASLIAGIKAQLTALTALVKKLQK